MKEETLKAQGSPSWLMPPWFKKHFIQMEIFLLGKVNLSLARGGMLIFIVCREKKKKKTANT